MTECRSCRFWIRSTRRMTGEILKSGSCTNERNMIFFGSPEEQGKTPNMNAATWEWETCDNYEMPHSEEPAP